VKVDDDIVSVRWWWRIDQLIATWTDLRRSQRHWSHSNKRHNTSTPTHIVNSFQWHLKTHLIRAGFSGAPRGKLLRCTYDSLVWLHTHTCLTTLFPGLPGWAGSRKVKTNLDFTETRDSEWQWHQLGHMQVCTLLQTDNYARTPPLSFYRPDALPAAQPTVSKHWRQLAWLVIFHKHFTYLLRHSSQPWQSASSDIRAWHELTSFNNQRCMWMMSSHYCQSTVGRRLLKQT